MKTGILLVNLGSPSEPTPKATRKYLAQFLKDRRVIELHPVLWWPILHGIILRTRPAKSARAYAKVWDQDENGKYAKYSALVETTFGQAQALQKKLGVNMIVKAAMRYGQPSIGNAIDDLYELGCKKILVVPMYPQFSSVTTESVYDAVEEAEKKQKLPLQIECTRSYPDHPLYISAITKSLKDFLARLDWQADKIIVSFHGLPKSNITKGDPYETECEQTYACMVKALPKLQNKMKLSYQSRFGPKEWLGPYTTEVLRECAKAGEKNIVIITPGFAADCLETLEELAINAKEEFYALGGQNLALVPCLNTNAEHISVLKNLVKTRLG